MVNEDKLAIGGHDGFTETVGINEKLYKEDQPYAEKMLSKLYGVHSHFNESAMSYNFDKIDLMTSKPYVRGDLPHVSESNLSNGLFMINKKGDIFFVNKTLAIFTVENINPYNSELRNKYIDQVYIGNIKQLKNNQ